MSGRLAAAWPAGGLRGPRLVYESRRGRGLRVRSWIFWLAALGVAAGSAAMLMEWLPGADDPATMLLALALALGGALHADRARRRFVVRLWQLPEGVVIETPGLLGPVRLQVPADRAALAEVGPADPHGPARGLIELRLPGESRRYLLDPGGGSIPFGAEKPRRR